MIFVNTKLIFKVLIIITLSGSIVLFSDTDFFLKIFSFYNINHLTPSFADFRSYQALPLTIEKGLDPYINHEYETREGLSSSLVTLWEDLFAHLGIDNYEIVKQLAIN